MNSKLTGEGDAAVPKYPIAIFGNKQRLLSLDMKTKVVQHVPRIIFNVFKVFEFSSFQVFKFFKTFLVPSFCLTFRHFLVNKWKPGMPWHGDKSRAGCLVVPVGSGM